MRLGLHFTRLPLRRGLDEVRFIEFPLFSVFTRWRPLRKMAPPGRVPLCNAGPGESPDLAGSGTWTAAAALESCLPPRCAERLASPASCIPSRRLDHKEAVYFATFSPDSKQARVSWRLSLIPADLFLQVVTASEDATAKIWVVKFLAQGFR